jgi:hypothetical protein
MSAGSLQVRIFAPTAIPIKLVPLNAENTLVWNTLIWEAMKVKWFKLAYLLYMDVSFEQLSVRQTRRLLP